MHTLGHHKRASTEPNSEDENLDQNDCPKKQHRLCKSDLVTLEMLVMCDARDDGEE